MKKKQFGLAARLIRMIMIVIFILTVAVTVVFGLRTHNLERIAEEEGKELALQVRKMTREGIITVIRDSIEKHENGELSGEELLKELIRYDMFTTTTQSFKYEELTEDMKARIRSSFHLNLILILGIACGLSVLSILTASRLAKKRVAPIDHMTKRIQELSGENAVFEMEEIYKTGDEIETLAEAFTDQSRKLRDYVEENLRITLEKEKLDAEMTLASQIQESMLPRSFPDRKEFDLFAKMVPAKTVGGDFYDFFFIDEDHLAIVIADVSGKGITAALFMALCKQALQSRLVLHGGEVKQAMEEANRVLCEESLEDMFVTVWMGVLSLSDGKLVFVDAGHNLAAVSRQGGDFALLEDHHGIILAAFPEWTYETTEITLMPGDKVFLYTDGVTEAHNGSDELFEEEGMLSALNEDPARPPKELDESVRSRIAGFAGEAEQFDDITTLCFQYFGKEGA